LLKHGATIIPSFADGGETCSDPVRVFVPLCGKTVDMAFLAQHPAISEMVGIDGIRKALDEFAEEQPELEVKAVENSPDSFERLKGKKATLLKGDFFALDADAAGGHFDSIWDRASLVAIDPTLREDYVQVMKKLLKPGGTILLMTIERRTGTEDGMKAGPPFSVPEKEVRRLYESQDWVESVEVIEEIDEFALNPDSKERYTSAGVTSFFELMFLIKSKP
jgi:thiopurine S-methyltransferase